MKTIVAATLILFSTTCMATTTSVGKISALEFMSDGTVVIIPATTRTLPSCASQQRMILNATTTAGKIQLAGLLAAYTAGQQFVLVGTDTCTLWADSETLAFFETFSP